jgi:hypothetical protein
MSVGTAAGGADTDVRPAATRTSIVKRKSARPSRRKESRRFIRGFQARRLAKPLVHQRASGYRLSDVIEIVCTGFVRKVDHLVNLQDVEVATDLRAATAPAPCIGFSLFVICISEL